jgi:glycosyltransferase involved in cell wall biosynthesis
MKSLKIVVVSDLHPKLVLGGGQSIAYEFYTLLTESGYNTEFWYTTSEKKNIVLKNSKEICIFSSLNKNRFLSKVKELLGGLLLFKFIYLLIVRKPSKIWIHQIGNNIPFIIIIFIKLLKIESIITLHDYLILSKYKIVPVDKNQRVISKLQDLNLSLYQTLRFFFYRLVVNNSNVIITVSELQKEILTNFGIRVTDVRPNGIAVCKHKKIVKNPSRKADRSILFAGRLGFKGLDILIQSANLAKKKWVIHLAGNSDLLSYVQSKGFDDYIYHGLLTRVQISSLIHKMDLVFACSQYYDPYPTICLESLRHGVPFITTITSGTSRIYSNEFAKKLIMNVGIVPDLDDIHRFTSKYKKEILSEGAKIPDVLEVYKSYLNTLGLEI